jgi:peptidyl-tRNA hydrolase
MNLGKQIDLYDLQDYPVLYLLVRTDIDSMNPGKLAAQCGHAVSMFMQKVLNPCLIDLQPQTNSVSSTASGKVDYKIRKTFNEWFKGDRGFGTKITLDIDSIENLNYIHDELSDAGYLTDLVHDPTYPLEDGEFTHLIPLVTCGYVFGNKIELLNHLNSYPLYK